MSIAWITLFVAGLFEIGMTTFLNLSEGLTKFPYRGLFIACSLLSFYLLSRATNVNVLGHIPMGTAYAVWTGIGAAGTAIVGMMFRNEPVSWPRILLLVGLIACVAGLQFLESGGEKGE